MKTTTLLLLLLFLVNSGSAETSVPYTPDSLKKGDWVEIESVHYYPYVAPGIEEKVPWRAENIRRVIFKATVTDLNERTLTLDYTFKSLSLRNKGCKSSICEIYTLFYTQECKIGCFCIF
ncbi:hypothetical protein [Parabacteroides merdae]|uniref:hypothetical protein n=1 Tax=Parabacteroides merdae TaxID=46503 RepID=UPI0022E32477|nr:hypothetical protein [Parabacteroides merdae]